MTPVNSGKEFGMSRKCLVIVGCLLAALFFGLPPGVSANPAPHVDQITTPCTDYFQVWVSNPKAGEIVTIAVTYTVDGYTYIWSGQSIDVTLVDGKSDYDGYVDMRTGIPAEAIAKRLEWSQGDTASADCPCAHPTDTPYPPTDTPVPPTKTPTEKPTKTPTNTPTEAATKTPTVLVTMPPPVTTTPETPTDTPVVPTKTPKPPVKKTSTPEVRELPNTGSGWVGLQLVGVGLLFVMVVVAAIAFFGGLRLKPRRIRR